MGKRTKEHKQKVAKRNARLQQEKNIFNKAYQAAMDVKVAELKEKFGSLSEDDVNVALNNQILDTTVVEPTDVTETETVN